eukprot:15478255-Alexandrium_andersonii.AAC.1
MARDLGPFALAERPPCRGRTSDRQESLETAAPCSGTYMLSAGQTSLEDAHVVAGLSARASLRG